MKKKQTQRKPVSSEEAVRIKVRENGGDRPRAGSSATHEQ